MELEPLNLCPFCSAQIESKVKERMGSVVAVLDKNPVTKGHILIIPIRHTPDLFSMTPKEIEDAIALINLLHDNIKRNDPTVTGFNIGANCGVSAGQTIMHAHIHLIPRRDGDTPNPRGGVRGVIPDKMSY
jgi:diadenosine tetraphosphate (Ap4A) HIT family hydrolase